jgi:phosphoglycerate kinase
MKVNSIKDIKISGRRLLIREDLNVPVKDGNIVNDARLRASLPTIQYALENDATLILMSHLGRPQEGVPIAQQQESSLAPVAKRLSEMLGVPVPLMSQDFSAQDAASLQAGSCVLLENVRCNKGEAADSDELAQYYASLCDVFVMDAFGTAHRAQASTHGVAKFAPISCAGLLLAEELAALQQALENPAKPMLAIVGGAKVSSKLQVLEALAGKVDQLIVGGGIANTFLAAAGYNVGLSLYEKDMLDKAREIMKMTSIPMPKDVRVAKEFSESAIAEVKAIADVAGDDMILDIGPETADEFVGIIAEMKTILWNGPLGVFEFEAFAGGTEAVARAVAANKGFSITGGGETITAIEKYKISDQVSYISTGGGAFLEFVEGKKLPAVSILEQKASSQKV